MLDFIKIVSVAFTAVSLAFTGWLQYEKFRLDGEWHILTLLENLDHCCTTSQLLLSGGIEVGTELGEGCNLAILGELQFQSPGDLLHRLPLRSRANARHREANIDRRADATIEELRLEEDLAVGD